MGGRGRLGPVLVATPTPIRILIHSHTRDRGGRIGRRDRRGGVNARPPPPPRRVVVRAVPVVRKRSTEIDIEIEYGGASGNRNNFVNLMIWTATVTVIKIVAVAVTATATATVSDISRMGGTGTGTGTAREIGIGIGDERETGIGTGTGIEDENGAIHYYHRPNYGSCKSYVNSGNCASCVPCRNWRREREEGREVPPSAPRVARHRLRTRTMAALFHAMYPINPMKACRGVGGIFRPLPTRARPPSPDSRSTSPASRRVTGAIPLLWVTRATIRGWRQATITSTRHIHRRQRKRWIR